MVVFEPFQFNLHRVLPRRIDAQEIVALLFGFPLFKHLTRFLDGKVWAKDSAQADFALVVLVWAVTRKNQKTGIGNLPQTYYSK